MSNLPTLWSRGRAVDRADRVIAGTGVFMAVLLQAGQEADSTLIDRTTLADVLAVSANKEAAWLGGTQYKRLTWAGAQVALAPDATNDRCDIKVASAPSWLAAGAWSTQQAISKIGLCYATATNSPTSAIWPVSWLDWQVTADGNDITYTPDASGIYRT